MTSSIASADIDTDDCCPCKRCQALPAPTPLQEALASYHRRTLLHRATSESQKNLDDEHARELERHGWVSIKDHPQYGPSSGYRVSLFLVALTTEGLAQARRDHAAVRPMWCEGEQLAKKRGIAVHDSAWQRELAMEAGMLHGVDAYNDTMGFGP